MLAKHFEGVSIMPSEQPTLGLRLMKQLKKKEHSYWAQQVPFQMQQYFT